MFACAEQHWRNCQVHFVDETLLEILSNSRHPAAEPYIFVTGRCSRRSQRSVDAICYKMKGGAALHRDWWPRIARQHKNRDVIRWVWAPPAFPAFILPRAAHWAEHVPAKNPSPQVLSTARSKVVVDARGSLIFAKHLLKRSRRIEPGMQLLVEQYPLLALSGQSD